jgi:hypothetical protein
LCTRQREAGAQNIVRSPGACSPCRRVPALVACAPLCEHTPRPYYQRMPVCATAKSAVSRVTVSPRVRKIVCGKKNSAAVTVSVTQWCYAVGRKDTDGGFTTEAYRWRRHVIPYIERIMICTTIYSKLTRFRCEGGRMKKYLFGAILLGCAAFLDTPDDYTLYAPLVAADSASEVYATDSGVVENDAGTPWDGEGRHLRRI